MRVQIDLTEEERASVKRYAKQEGYTMKHAYGELIRESLERELDE